MSDNFKYFAFISYSSHDIEWGKRLQRKLEHYRLPATLCSEHNLPRNPIKPVFFAPTDIQPGGLTEELQERLRASRHLIVICSPYSARSEWVGIEIEFFHSLGRAKDIHFFIVEGLPHSGKSETECYNPILEKLGIPEVLGANIHENIYRRPWLNRERAYVQLISKLLGVEFDTIWQRHKRSLINTICSWFLGIIAVICLVFGVWEYNQIFDAKVSIIETSVHNDNLPDLKDVVVTMTLKNEKKIDTLKSLDTCVVFTNVPHRFLNKRVEFKVEGNNEFLVVDTFLRLRKHTVLNIQRNPFKHGMITFSLYNPEKEIYYPNVDVEIEGIKSVSDSNGFVQMFIPLELQKIKYKVKASVDLNTDVIGTPCGGYEFLHVK